MVAQRSARKKTPLPEEPQDETECEIGYRVLWLKSLF